ncbi:MAG: PQQ-like beta-propeller repeat protein [Actinomycetia bacterium]|nr:PQQ-like beta-propeller repeat protein [Actinomycetes bacterium]
MSANPAETAAETPPERAAPATATSTGTTDTSAAEAAVRRHRAAMRRAWRWYSAALAALLVAVGVLVGVVWANSDAAHTTLRTASTPAPTLQAAAPAAHPQLAWQSDDTAALNAPFVDGTVVTYSAHTVTGRDARTGDAVWTYTRSNVAVCAVAQAGGVTVAFYDSHCDQVTALDSDTGERVWTRTLDQDAGTIDGRPQLLATSDTIFIWTDSVLYAIDTGGGLNRWMLSADPGCAFTGLAPGQGGVLVAERCDAGEQLLLRDRYSGTDDKATTDDGKQRIAWRVAANGVTPVAADDVALGYDSAAQQLVAYDLGDGAALGNTPLSPAPSAAAALSPGGIARAALQGAEAVWIGDRVYLLGGTGSTVLWSAPAAAPPTVISTAEGFATPDVNSAALLVPTGTAIDQLGASNGRPAASYPVPAESNALVYRLGTGFLTSVDGRTEVYL